MIIDLNEPSRHEVQSDVLVIGAGTVGLVAASRLTERGYRVVVVESGGMRQDGETHELNEVVQTGSPYQGAAHGRFRCLGGTSSRWGGALIPFAAADCRLDEWPMDPAEVFRYIPEVESLFGLTPGPYDIDGVFKGMQPGFCARLAKWPQFRHRNVATLYARQLRESRDLQVWLNATATEFNVSQGSLHSVIARSRTGGELRISAREVIIAAGAIETTRLLLLMDEQNGNSLFGDDSQLGRFFSDHLSVAIADVEVTDRNALNMLLGFRFERKGVMRNIRFELSEHTSLRHSIPACFAHVSFTDAGSSGFNALREAFRLLQQRRLPTPQLIGQLVVSTPWLARALWWRFARQRLMYPANAQIQLHLVVEQVPRAENQIRLCVGRVDAFGQPLAEISWDVAPEDIENVRRAMDALVNAWHASAMAACTRLKPYAFEHIARQLGEGGGIFHPVGSARMAERPERGAVDRNLRPFRVRNVSVVSTAVLPRSGGSNPTMTLLCLGLHCSDRLSQRMRAPSPGSQPAPDGQNCVPRTDTLGALRNRAPTTDSSRMNNVLPALNIFRSRFESTRRSRL